MSDISQKDLIINVFEGKICLYKESGRINMVHVDEVKIDEWGVKFMLTIVGEYEAFDGEEDAEYEFIKNKVSNSFEFSGAWDISSFNIDSFHVAYVNGILNVKQKSIEYFKNKETDYLRMWKGI